MRCHSVISITPKHCYHPSTNCLHFPFFKYESCLRLHWALNYSGAKWNRGKWLQKEEPSVKLDPHASSQRPRMLHAIFRDNSIWKSKHIKIIRLSWYKKDSGLLRRALGCVHEWVWTKIYYAYIVLWTTEAVLAGELAAQLHLWWILPSKIV